MPRPPPRSTARDPSSGRASPSYASSRAASIPPWQQRRRANVREREADDRNRGRYGRTRMKQLEVRLLGRFEVLVDSQPVPADAWAQRRAADLVKLLALARGHRMARDEVLEPLWPQLGPDAAASNLHKAASYARRALGDRGAVLLRGGVVELAPAAEVTTDVERFERGDDSAYGGELLPDERYEQWALAGRARLRERRLALMRSEGRWDDVLREDAADEAAHRALMRRHAATGDRPAAA